MRKVIRKLFFIWDYEKEEKWLNEMAAKGLALISVKLCAYEFENTLPGEYQVCLQVLEHTPHHPESENYIHFLEETGIQHVGAYIRQVYFRKKTADGPFKLFSDNTSRIRQMNQIITLLTILTIPNLGNSLNQFGMYGLYRHPAHLFAALLALGVAALLMIGIVKLSLRKKKLKEEQQIFEG